MFHALARVPRSTPSVPRLLLSSPGQNLTLAAVGKRTGNDTSAASPLSGIGTKQPMHFPTNSIIVARAHQCCDFTTAGDGASEEHDAEKYAAMLRDLAGCRNKDRPRKSEEILRQMQEDYESGRSLTKPDTGHFNILISSWAKSSVKGAAERAESILDHMEKLHKAGNLDVKPNTVSFTAAMDAWARSRKKGAAQRAERLLQRMQELYDAGDLDVKPDTISFNSVINAWAKSNEIGAAQRTEDILNHMLLLNESGKLDAMPNVRTFSAVISAWSRSGDKDAVRRVLSLHDKMASLSDEGYPDLQPNTVTYTTIINTVKRSDDTQKAAKAKAIVDGMEEQYHPGNQSVKPDIQTYNGVIWACVATVGNDEVKQLALQIAQDTFKRIQEKTDVNPDEESYAAFLQACYNLARGAQRARLMEEIFRRCCSDGLLTQKTLKTVKNLTSDIAFQSLLGSEAKVLAKGVDVDDLPTEWRRNVSSRWYNNK